MHKISIPQPCHEKWEEMTPQGNGSFCGQCSKVVVDFTQMTDDEVQNYFIQHAHEKLCGRFRAVQVDNIRVEIPSYLIFKEPAFLKKFILITLVVFGTTLYSCTNSSGKPIGTEFVINGHKDSVPPSGHTIGKIAAPVDTAKKSCNKKVDENIMGDIAFVPIDSTKLGEVQVTNDTAKTGKSDHIMGVPADPK